MKTIIENFGCQAADNIFSQDEIARYDRFSQLQNQDNDRANAVSFSILYSFLSLLVSMPTSHAVKIATKGTWRFQKSFGENASVHFI